MTANLRPCAACGTPDKRPPAAFSTVIDEAAASRGWSDADLAAAAGLSAGYAWRIRRSHKMTSRPSFTAASRLVDALELTGDDRRLVLQSARAGVGLDLEDAS